MNFLSIIEEFQEIILATETIEFVNEENISRLKLKIKFIDSTYLSVRELNSKFYSLYSYYCLREDHSVIIGWDNAPHHRNIENFPYHKHKNNQIEPTSKVNLRDVLNEIRIMLVPN